MKPSPKKNNNDIKSTPRNTQRKAPPKSNKMDVSPKNEVKEMFIKWFSKRNKVGQIMSKSDVVKNILTKLDAKQESSFDAAVNELKNDGIIEIKEDGVTLVLTQKGSDFV